MRIAAPRRALPHQPRNMAPLLAALLLSSLMSVATVVFRVYYSGSSAYVFLVWNLFLAWAPLLCALALWQFAIYGRRATLLLLPFLGCWFLFFPNSPYIVTDFLHLTQRHNIPLWYDLLLIFSFAWNGLILGFVSLWIVQGVIQALYGRWLSWVTVSATLAASGFGIYLGRFLRWNSWDLLTDPYGLARDIYVRLADPLAHPHTLAVTVLFSGFLAVAYLTFALLLRTRGPGPTSS
ncbi:MAG: DUF1361 domain-containing protein [Caldilineaceae bacterium]|nr:DUF1361 domain-containing protein [Caldilineaceae bacterium]